MGRLLILFLSLPLFLLGEWKWEKSYDPERKIAFTLSSKAASVGEEVTFEMRAELPEKVDLKALKEQMLALVNLVTEVIIIEEEELKPNYALWTFSSKIPGEILLNTASIPLMNQEKLVGPVIRLTIQPQPAELTPILEEAEGVLEPRLHAQLAVSEENREKWMDGPKALYQQAKSNQIHFKRWSISWYFYGWLLMGFLILVWIIVNYKEAFAKRLRKERHPHLEALKKLETVSKENVDDTTDLVRDYLESGFHIPARFRTTSEVTDATKEWKSQEKLQDFLQVGDQYKFDPDYEGKIPENHLEKAREVINALHSGKENK